MAQVGPELLILLSQLPVMLRLQPGTSTVFTRVVFVFQCSLSLGSYVSSFSLALKLTSEPSPARVYFRCVSTPSERLVLAGVR